MRLHQRVAIVIVCLITPAVSHAEENILPLVDALFGHMAGTYLCRIELGGISHYQAARSIAINKLSQYLGRNEAVLAVDKMDKKFRADPRTLNPVMDAAWCLELVNDGLYRIEVESAKLPLQ